MTAENKVRLIIEADGRDAAETIRRLNSQLGGTADAADRAGRQGKALSGAFGDLTRHAHLLAGALAGVGATLSVREALGEFKQFQTALVDMGKVTDESLDSIRKKVMTLPPELGSATQLVQGYYQAISAGVTDPAEAMDMLTVAAQSAKAAHVDQAETIKALTKLMAGYDGEVRNAAEAADLLFTIESAGQTEFRELVPVIGEAAAVSHQLAVSSEEMGAGLANMTQTAGTVAQAATQYKAVMMGLFKPTAEMAKALEELGFESGRAAVEQLGLAGAIQALAKYAESSGVGMGKLFESSEALVGLVPMLNDGFAKFNERLEAMRNKAGAADKAFQEWRKTFDAVEETFRNTIGKFAIEFGEELAPKMMEGMKGVSGWLENHRDDLLMFFGNLADAGEGIGKTLVPALGSVVAKLAEISAWLDKLPPAARDALLLGGATFLATRNPALAGLAGIYGALPSGMNTIEEDWDRGEIGQLEYLKMGREELEEYLRTRDTLEGLAKRIENLQGKLGRTLYSQDKAEIEARIKELKAQWAQLLNEEEIAALAGTGDILIQERTPRQPTPAQRKAPASGGDGKEPPAWRDWLESDELAPRLEDEPSIEDDLAEENRRREEAIALAEAMREVDKSLSEEQAEAVLRRVELEGEAHQEALDSMRTWLDGASAGFEQYADMAQDTFAQFGDLAEGATRIAEDALADFVIHGKGDLGDLFDYAYEQLVRIGIQQAALGPLAEGLSGALSSPGSGGGLFSFLAGIFHEGGVVGVGLAPQRAVPPSVFLNAPRLHTGLAPDEFPAILQYGERVTPRGQAGSEPPVFKVDIHTEPGTQARVEHQEVYFDQDRWFGETMIRVIRSNSGGAGDFFRSGGG